MNIDLKRCWHQRKRKAASVLLLHGLGSSGDDWALQLPALAARYSVLTVDLRGHGDSPASREWPSISDMAADVRRLLRSESVGPVHVVGLSLGAAVALQLALDHPSAVRSLTLVNGFARLRLGRRGAWTGAVRLLLLLLGRMDWLGRWVARTIFPEPDAAALRRQAAARLAANSRAAYLRALWALRSFDVRDRLHEIDIPALVVVGDRDPVVPERAKLELIGGLPYARRVTIEGSGHATPLDAAPSFNQELLAFLRAVDR